MLKLFRYFFSSQGASAQGERAIGDPGLEHQVITNTALQGDLSVVTIENLMQLVSHAGLSGELCLTTSNNKACFIVRNGALVFGHIDMDFPRIGERLVEAGHISAENLQECLAIYHEYQGSNDKKRLGELLVEKEFVLAVHLEEIVKEQIKDSFFQGLSWSNGIFTFCADNSQPDETIHLDERIDHLIIEGILALDHNSA